MSPTYHVDGGDETDFQIKLHSLGPPVSCYLAVLAAEVVAVKRRGIEVIGNSYSYLEGGDWETDTK